MLSFAGFLEVDIIVIIANILPQGHRRGYDEITYHHETSTYHSYKSILVIIYWRTEDTIDSNRHFCALASYLAIIVPQGDSWL